MRIIDRQYTEKPFYGARRMAVELKKLGYLVGRKKVRTLMEKMGLQAIYPKPNLSLSNPEDKKYPYLLRGIVIDRIDQVWSIDITYIPLAEGFGYLVAIIDWFSRKVLAWEFSNLLDIEFCMKALNKALKNKKPEIFNTDQGSQFTSREFTGRLEAGDIRISMDGRGRALDNVFIERLWRSVKYENVYPKDYQNMVDARSGLGEYFEFYNERRWHQSLNYQTPSAIYSGIIESNQLQGGMNKTGLNQSYDANVTPSVAAATSGVMLLKEKCRKDFYPKTS
jgi:putative transposase